MVGAWRYMRKDPCIHYTHAYIHTYTHACVYTHTVHVNGGSVATYTCIPTYMHAYACIYIYIYIYIYTHTHTEAMSMVRAWSYM